MLPVIYAKMSGGMPLSMPRFRFESFSLATLQAKQQATFQSHVLVDSIKGFSLSWRNSRSGVHPIYLLKSLDSELVASVAVTTLAKQEAKLN